MNYYNFFMLDKEDLLLELESLPRGYISLKKINGKLYHYLQYKDGNKLISKYIASKDLIEVENGLKRREEIVKLLKLDYETAKAINHLSPHTLELSGYVMSKDIIVAEFAKGALVYLNDELAPLIIIKRKDLLAFLSSRVLDTSRTNARLLKRIMGIHGEEDYILALKNHATSVTDNYWFKSKGSRLTYNDVRLDNDLYHEVSLDGYLSHYPSTPKLSPQYSLLGSYEKCWRYIDNEWWIYKKENEDEILSELISSELSLLLNIPTAYYERSGKYIRSLNFSSHYNYESLSAISGDDDRFEHVFNDLYSLDINLASQYLYLIWFDVLVNNVDRHNENIGLLRDVNNGKIISLAPNFDLNMSLFSRTHSLEKKMDGLMKLYLKFVKNDERVINLYKKMKLPILEEEKVESIIIKYHYPGDVEELLNYIMYRYESLKIVFNL